MFGVLLLNFEDIACHVVRQYALSDSSQLFFLLECEALSNIAMRCFILCCMQAKDCSFHADVQLDNQLEQYRQFCSTFTPALTHRRPFKSIHARKRNPTFGSTVACDPALASIVACTNNRVSCPLLVIYTFGTRVLVSSLLFHITVECSEFQSDFKEDVLSTCEVCIPYCITSVYVAIYTYSWLCPLRTFMMKLKTEAACMRSRMY